jgi:hypothetical protein
MQGYAPIDNGLCRWQALQPLDSGSARAFARDSPLLVLKSKKPQPPSNLVLSLTDASSVDDLECGAFVPPGGASQTNTVPSGNIPVFADAR